MKQRKHALCLLKAIRAADAAGEQLEIVPAEFERECPGVEVQFYQPAFHLPGELLKYSFHTVPASATYIGAVSIPQSGFQAIRLHRSPYFLIWWCCFNPEWERGARLVVVAEGHALGGL